MKNIKKEYKIIITIICIILFGLFYKNSIKKNKLIISNDYSTKNKAEEEIKIDKEEELKITQKQEVFLEEKPLVTQKEADIEQDIVVYITGEIKKEGVYTLSNKSRINDVVELAGGLTELADVKKINLAKVLIDEEHIHILSVNDKEDVLNEINVNTTNTINKTNSEKSDIININTANATDLMKLPSVGEVTANNIILYRETNGSFKTIEDIKNVDRIGEKTFIKIKDMIKVKD